MRNCRLFFLSLFLIVISFPNLKAQDDEKVNLKLRHIKGIEGIDLGAGITKFSTYYQISYYYFLNNNYFIKPSLSLEIGKIGLTTYNEYSLFISFERNLFKIKDFIFLNAGLAPVPQLQNTQNDVLDKSGTYFPMGISADVNLEVFVLSKIALFGSFNEIYSPKDKFGNFRYMLGGGIKIDLN